MCSSVFGSVCLQCRTNEEYVGRDEHQKHDFAAKKMHEHFVKMSPSDDFKVLDYSCGPTIANVISASRVATEIVLVEYTKEGRAAIQQWLDKDPNAFNWSPYFKYVVQTLEGETTTAAKQREGQLRTILKAVVHCDIAQDPPIEKDHQGPYDVVISYLCITNGCKTSDDFLKAVSKLARLVKSGGYLLLCVIEPEQKSGSTTYYNIGNKIYSALAVDRAFVQSSLERDFQEITVESIPLGNYNEEMHFFSQLVKCKCFNLLVTTPRYFEVYCKI